MIRTVITCDVCERKIDKDDATALVFIEGGGKEICIRRRVATEDYLVITDICGEACLHKHLSRLLPNL